MKNFKKIVDAATLIPVIAVQSIPIVVLLIPRILDRVQLAAFSWQKTN
jgi:hypothetical protein